MAIHATPRGIITALLPGIRAEDPERARIIRRNLTAAHGYHPLPHESLRGYGQTSALAELAEVERITSALR